MPECSPHLPQFRGWTCADRNGRSNEQAAAAAAALTFSNGRVGGSAVASSTVDMGVTGMVTRNILGDELTVLGEDATGLAPKKFFLLFLTLAGGLCCLGLCMLGRLARAVRQGARRHKRRFAILRPRAVRPMRLANDEELEGEEDDEDILE